MIVIALVGMLAGIVAAVFAVWAVRQNSDAARRDTERNHVSWDLDQDLAGHWSIRNTGRDPAHEVYISAWVDETEQVVERPLVGAGEVVPLPDLRIDPDDEDVEEEEEAPSPYGGLFPRLARFDIPKIRFPKTAFSGYEVRWRSPAGRWSSDRGSGMV